MISFAALALLASSAFAASAERTLLCDYNDHVLRYHDEYTFVGEESVRAVFSIGSSAQAPLKACWGDSLKQTPVGERIELTGEIECTDGKRGEFFRTFDPARVEISGGWMGAQGCAWK